MPSMQDNTNFVFRFREPKCETREEELQHLTQGSLYICKTGSKCRSVKAGKAKQVGGGV